MGNWNCNGQNGCGCGCNLFANLSRALNNLFSTGCNNNHGCGCNCWNNFANGFTSGVNAANAAQAWQNNGGCGCGNGWNNASNRSGCGCGNGNTPTPTNFSGGNSCGCGCGSNADLSAYTACDNQCFDPYYAQQYALYPFGQSNCNCGF